MEAVVALLVLMAVGFMILALRYSKLIKENKVLKETLAIKDHTIAQLKRQQHNPKGVAEDETPSSISKDAVLALLREGKSIEEISKALQLPLSEIELIVKLEKIRSTQSIK